MTREESLQNIQNNQYVSGGTGGMNLMYLAFGNPITDSMVVNAYAKTNSAAFEIGLKTGIYNNNTVLGGNFLYNALQGNGFTGRLFKNAKTGSIQPFKKLSFLGENSRLRNFSLNFLASSDIEGTTVAKVAEETGLDKTSEIVRTGWGFGRDHSGFFNQLKKMGYEPSKFGKKNVLATKPVKVFSDGMGEGIVGDIYEDVIIQEVIGKEFVDTGMGLVGEVDITRDKLAVKAWNALNLSDDLSKVILSGTDDEVIKLADEFIKMGGKLTNYSSSAKIATKELREEMIEQAGKYFASRTIFQKIISNPVVRIATGAAIALPAPIAIPLTVLTTGIGITASVGQENAVNNFINSHLYNETQYDRYSSEEAMSSLYSATNIRDVNIQALANAYRDVNVANRYLNDMDSISSDYKYSLDDAETI